MSLRTKILINAKAMPAMSSTIVKLGKLVNDPETPMDDIVRALQLDPGITANVLKLANSAALGLPRQVSSISEAVVRIGTKQLYHIALSSSLKPMVDKTLGGYDLEEGFFWRHSIAVASASETIAQLLRKKAGDAFTAGILHDVGKQVISDFIQRNNESFNEIQGADTTFDAIERDILGIDHAELGASVLEKWNFPSPLINATRYHHRPDETTEDQTLVDIVHVANAISSSAGLGIGSDSLQYELYPTAIERLGLIDEQMDKVLCTTVEKTQEFEKLMKSL